MPTTRCTRPLYRLLADSVRQSLLARAEGLRAEEATPRCTQVSSQSYSKPNLFCVCGAGGDSIPNPGAGGADSEYQAFDKVSELPVMRDRGDLGNRFFASHSTSIFRAYCFWCQACCAHDRCSATVQQLGSPFRRSRRHRPILWFGSKSHEGPRCGTIFTLPGSGRPDMHTRQAQDDEAMMMPASAPPEANLYGTLSVRPSPQPLFCPSHCPLRSGASVWTPLPECAQSHECCPVRAFLWR